MAQVMLPQQGPVCQECLGRDYRVCEPPTWSPAAERPTAFANSLTRNLREAPEGPFQHLSRCIWEAIRFSGNLVGKALTQAQRCWLAARDGIGLSITWTPPGLYSVLMAPVTLHSMWLEVGVHAEAERRFRQ